MLAGLKRVWLWLRVVLPLALVVAVLVAAVVFVRSCDRKLDAIDAGGKLVAVPRAPLAKEYPPERYTPVPVVEPRPSLVDKLRPGRKKSRGEELLEGKRPGTDAIDVKGEVIYRTPEGEYYTTQNGSTVVVFRKPEPFASFEVRPSVGAVGYAVKHGDDYEPAAGVMGRVDGVRIWRIHGGAGVIAGTGPTVGIAATTAYNLTHNADAVAFGGMSTRGPVFGVGLSLSWR